MGKKKKSFKEDASVKSGNPAPFSLNSAQMPLAGPVIWSQALSSQVSALVVFGLCWGDVLDLPQHQHIPAELRAALSLLEGEEGQCLAVSEHSGQPPAQRCVCNSSAPTKPMFKL